MAAYGNSFWYCWADNSGSFGTNGTKFDVVTVKTAFSRPRTPLGSPVGAPLPSGSASLPPDPGSSATLVRPAGAAISQWRGPELLRSAVADDFLALYGAPAPDWKTAIVLAPADLAAGPSDPFVRS